MSQRDNQPRPQFPPGPGDISHRARSIARCIDRACRQPGEYVITLTIPPNSRLPWTVRIARQQLLKLLNLRQTRHRQ